MKLVSSGHAIKIFKLVVDIAFFGLIVILANVQFNLLNTVLILYCLSMTIVQNVITKTLGINTLVPIFVTYMVSREFLNNTNLLLIITISQIFFLTNYIIKVNKKISLLHLLLMINVLAAAYFTDSNQLICLIIASFVYASFLELYQRIKHLKKILFIISIFLNIFYYIINDNDYSKILTLGIVLILIMRRSEVSLFLVILIINITVFKLLQNDNSTEIIAGITLYSMYLIFSYNKWKERSFILLQILVLLVLYFISLFQSDYSNYGSIKSEIITITMSVIILFVIFDNKYRIAKVLKIGIDPAIRTNNIRNLLINQQVSKQFYNNGRISFSSCSSANLNYLFFGWKLGFNSHPLLNEEWFQFNLMQDKWTRPLIHYFSEEDKSCLNFSPWVVSNWFNEQYKLNNSLSAFENYILQDDNFVLNPSPSFKRYEVMERIGIKNDLEPLEVLIIEYPHLIELNPIPEFKGNHIFRFY